MSTITFKTTPMDLTIVGRVVLGNEGKSFVGCPACHAAWVNNPKLNSFGIDDSEPIYEAELLGTDKELQCSACKRLLIGDLK
jgi:hypothetical protein